MSDDNDYYAVMNQKLKNRKELYNKKIDISKSENQLTTKLLYHYDKKFDSLYMKNQEFNDDIENKDQLININNNEFKRKNDIVLVLKYLLCLLLFIFFIIIVRYLKIINHTIANNLFIFSIIVYVVIIYYKIKYNKFTLGEERANQFAYDSTSSIFKEAARILLPQYMTRDRCPKGCKHKHHLKKCPKDLPGCDDSDNIRIKEMSTDSTLNNWKYGDILYQDCEVISPSELLPSELNDLKKRGINLNDRLMKCPLRKPYMNPDTNEVVKYIIMNEPEPWYASVENKPKSTTIYECEWEGVGEPLGDQGYNFNSQIPCHHYPNYVQKSVKIGGEKVN